MPHVYINPSAQNTVSIPVSITSIRHIHLLHPFTHTFSDIHSVHPSSDLDIHTSFWVIRRTRKPIITSETHLNPILNELNPIHTTIIFIYILYKYTVSIDIGAGGAQYSIWLRTGLPGDRGSIPGRGKDFSSSLCSDRLWGPPSLLYNGYRESFPWG
jgi:hypothetical protein